MTHFPPPTTNLDALHDLLAQTEAITQRWLDRARTADDPPAANDIASITLSVRRIALLHRDVYRLENPHLLLNSKYEPKPQPKSNPQTPPSPSPTPVPASSPLHSSNFPLHSSSSSSSSPDRPYCIIPAMPSLADDDTADFDLESDPDADPDYDHDHAKANDYVDPMLWMDPVVAEHNRRFVEYLYPGSAPDKTGKSSSGISSPASRPETSPASASKPTPSPRDSSESDSSSSPGIHSRAGPSGF